MTDNLLAYNLLAYRQVPLWALLDLNWAHRLSQGGYHTVGDVLDATPEALARNVMGVGPVRAKQIHGKIVNYVNTRTFNDQRTEHYAEFYQVEASDVIDEVFPSLRDAVATIGSLVLIGGLFAATVWWLS